MSLTELTVITNAELAVPPVPSFTTNVKFDVPNAFKAGVITAEQFGAVPENTTLDTGINAVFVEVIVTEVAHDNVDSTSEIVKAIAPVGVSSFVT